MLDPGGDTDLCDNDGELAASDERGRSPWLPHWWLPPNL